MKFWDSSALVPLLLAEETSDRLLSLYQSEPGVLAWWSSDVECASAIARLERQDLLSPREASEAALRLVALSESWSEVGATQAVRRVAKRLLRTHDLRAADSLQLAAALEAAEGRPASLAFVCLDDRLCVAAAREGLDVWDRVRLTNEGPIGQEPGQAI